MERGVIGAQRVASAAKEIDAAAGALSRDEMEALVAQLATEVDRALAAFEQEIEGR